LWIKATWTKAANIKEYAAMDRRQNKGLRTHGMGGETAPNHRKTALYKTRHTDPELDTQHERNQSTVKMDRKLTESKSRL